MILFKKRDEATQEEADLEIGLQNMQQFYHELQFSLLNAVRENLLNLTLAKGSAEDDIETYYQHLQQAKKWHVDEVDLM